MKLAPEPFEKMKEGTKTIELRLNDMKRKTVMTGDTVTFVNAKDPSKTFAATVLRLHAFPSFRELYRALPLEKCGYSNEELITAKPEDMDAYYSKEDQLRFGVLGIEIKKAE
jgi:ASC-1-like (ASCH) protein